MQREAKYRSTVNRNVADACIRAFNKHSASKRFLTLKELDDCLVEIDIADSNLAYTVFHLFDGNSDGKLELEELQNVVDFATTRDATVRARALMHAMSSTENPGTVTPATLTTCFRRLLTPHKRRQLKIGDMCRVLLKEGNILIPEDGKALMRRLYRVIGFFFVVHNHLDDIVQNMNILGSTEVNAHDMLLMLVRDLKEDTQDWIEASTAVLTLFDTNHSQKLTLDDLRHMKDMSGEMLEHFGALHSLLRLPSADKVQLRQQHSLTTNGIVQLLLLFPFFMFSNQAFTAFWAAAPFFLGHGTISEDRTGLIVLLSSGGTLVGGLMGFLSSRMSRSAINPVLMFVSAIITMFAAHSGSFLLMGSALTVLAGTDAMASNYASNLLLALFRDASEGMALLMLLGQLFNLGIAALIGATGTQGALAIVCCTAGLGLLSFTYFHVFVTQKFHIFPKDEKHARDTTHDAGGRSIALVLAFANIYTFGAWRAAAMAEMAGIESSSSITNSLVTIPLVANFVGTVLGILIQHRLSHRITMALVSSCLSLAAAFVANSNFDDLRTLKIAASMFQATDVTFRTCTFQSAAFGVSTAAKTHIVGAMWLSSAVGGAILAALSEAGTEFSTISLVMILWCAAVLCCIATAKLFDMRQRVMIDKVKRGLKLSFQ